MANYIVKSRQNLCDIALQLCGSMEAAYDIAAINGLNLTDDLTIGTVLELPTTTDTKTTQHYAANYIVPATAITIDEINVVLNGGEGIDFWGIEYDFIVT